MLALRGVARLAPMADGRSPEQIVELLGRAAALAGGATPLKSLMSALGQVPSAAAARLAATFLDDPALVDEASLAIVQIAENGDIADRKEVLGALKQVTAVCRNPLILARAESVPSRPNLARGATATNPDGLAADGQAGGPAGGHRRQSQNLLGRGRRREALPASRADEACRPSSPRCASRASGSTISRPGFRGPLRRQGRQAGERRPYIRTTMLTVLAAADPRARRVELKITGYYGGSPAIRELEIYGPDE